MSRKQPKYDIVVYGGTSAGIAAAVQAVNGEERGGCQPGHRLGGLSAGGLGDTDHGMQDTIGGISREFYERVGQQYGETEAVWYFEPSVALSVFQSLVSEHRVPVFCGERLDLADGQGVARDGTRIESICTESGTTYSARMFIDATYEGDLMAKAGVSYAVGREANDLYGETRNGIRDRTENELPDGIDPYCEPGNPASDLLPRVNPDPGGMPGDGDRKVQAYGYRMCLTDRPENRLMIEKPAGYDERDYEILFRALAAGMPADRVFKLRVMRNRKTDSNNHYGISCDYNGGNHLYPEGDYATRAAIAKRHEVYQRGLVWTVQNHPRVPQEVKDLYGQWGLPKDEFEGTENWTPQLYIRESRRMQSDYVVTEHAVLRRDVVVDPVGLGSYAMDSHHTQYYINDRGYVSTEGGFYDRLRDPYPISYRAIVPRCDECVNLFVPVCCSATHAAYGSIRMEPVFMILGQSAAMAAALCIDSNCDAQDVEYSALRVELERYGQILEYSGGKERTAAAPSGIVVENLGVGGENSSEARSAFGPVLASRPEHLVIFYGMNDALNTGKLVPLPTFVENLTAMVCQAVEDGIRNVFLVGIHPVNTEYLAERHPTHPEIARLQDHLGEYNEAIRQIAAATGATFVDWRARFLGESPGATIEGAVANRTNALIRCEANAAARDGNHLTAEGYRFLADEVARALRPKVVKGERVVCMGDSITYGSHMVGQSTATGMTYPASLVEGLRDLTASSCG